MKDKHRSLLAFLILFVIGGFFQYKYLNEFPSHVHAWAQSDRYALALRFLENDLNFFHPETYVLNPEFPDKWQTPTEGSITPVDFPVHDFIPAVIMKVTGSEKPFIFRGYIFLYSILGLFFLYLLTFRLTANFWKSLFVGVFAATAPVFVYYQGSFLPTIPSLANAVIGLFFYVEFLAGSKRRHFHWSLLFLTLAALSRTTFAIPLLAVFISEFLRIVYGKTSWKEKLVPVILAVGTLVFYFFYNQTLRDQYGSIFLSHFMPARSFSEAKEILEAVITKWSFTYFSVYHYSIFGAILLIAGSLWLKGKILLSELQFQILKVAGISLLGCILFSVLMLRQFAVHDYYFLDTFFLPLILLLIVFLSLEIKLIASKAIRFTSTLLIGLFGVPMVVNAYYFQLERHQTHDWDRVNVTIENFRGSEEYLDSIGISATDKILVIDPVAPNIPFILMDRKGFIVMITSEENIKRALNWDFDYVVTQNEFFLSEVYSVYPGILSKLEKVDSNGKITVSVLSEIDQKQSAVQFLGLGDEIAYQESTSFETATDGNWHGAILDSTEAYSGKYSTRIAAKTEFGPTFQTDSIGELLKSDRKLLFEGALKMSQNKGLDLVITVENSSGENIFYKSARVGRMVHEQNEWKNLSLLVDIPALQANETSVFKIYFWNPNQSVCLLDDISFRVY